MQIRIAESDENKKACLDLRHQVLIDELQLPGNIVLEPEEDNEVLFIGTEGEQPVCGGRVISNGPEVKVGHIAVVSKWRGQGIGARMLYFIEDWARGKFRRIVVSVPKAVEHFFIKHGYSTTGESVEKAGVEFVTLQLVMALGEPAAVQCRHCGEWTVPLSPSLAAFSCSNCGAELQRGGPALV
ncbi:GNAT family N-acetyltransferase [Planctomycetota bacterium]